MKINSTLVAIACLIIYLVLAFSGCSELKAQPAEGTAFTGDVRAEMTEQRERFPFNRVWFSKDYRQRRDYFTKLVVPPVNTAYLSEMGWWQKQSVKNQETLAQDTKKLSEFARATVTNAFQNDPNHRYTVVSEAGPKTLVLQLAITEIIPSKAWLNSAATVAGFFVPGAGLLSMTGTGSCALEGRLVDGENGKLLGAFADREEDKTALANFQVYTFYGGAEESIKDWANQFVELANTPVNVEVSDSSPIKLLRW